MSESCVFCDEQSKSENTFAETDLWRARWDLYPATPGHVEVVPKRHAQYLDQLTDDETNTLLGFARRVMQLIRETDLVLLYNELLPSADDHNRPLQEAALNAASQHSEAPSAFNLGINDGPDAGQSVHHLHLHLMPRWVGDVANPRGGVRNLFAQDGYKDLS